MRRRSRICGCGSYLPPRCISNDELAATLDTTDTWIFERTGIRRRHVAAEDERTSDLAVNAARRALDGSELTADAIDLVVVATSTPDYTFPAAATQVQAALNITRGAAFDLQAVCSGFVYAVSVADALIRTGEFTNAIVIGAETFSRILDWTDRSTCVLFGDGAGALVLTAEEGNGTNADRGILSTRLHADGRYRDMLFVDGGPSSTQTVGHLRMNGREVFRHATSKLAAVIDETLEANGLTGDDIDWFVPHQANRRIIDATARRLGLPESRVVHTIERHANTSAASIPLALAEACGDGRIKPGNLVLIEAMGGGFTWGASLIRW